MTDIDRGYARFAARLRTLRPRLAEREIGLAWMRCQTAAAGQADVKLEEPDDFAVSPEDIAEHGPVVVVHLLFDEGSALNTAIAVRDVPILVEGIAALNLDRIDVRDFIEEMFLLQKHTEISVAQCMTAAALWNGLQSDAGAALQAVIDDGHCRLVYQISHFLHHGKQAVNFRMLAGDQRRSLADLLVESAKVPRTNRELARRAKP